MVLFSCRNNGAAERFFITPRGAASRPSQPKIDLREVPCRDSAREGQSALTHACIGFNDSDSVQRRDPALFVLVAQLRVALMGGVG